MDPAGRTLSDALLGAYRAHVTGRLHGRGWPVDEAALSRGEDWLREALSELLSLPYRDQARTPFELFQEAMAFPTEALSAAGVDEPVRDAAARVALPGDRYDLAPASSSELSEEAWRAHLAWGAAKAAAFRPTLILLSRNLLDRQRLEDAAARAGYAVVGPDHEGAAAVAFVDLEDGSADSVISDLSGRGVRVIAYGPHVDEFAMTRSRALGATEALPRSRFFRDPGAWLPPLV